MTEERSTLVRRHARLGWWLLLLYLTLGIVLEAFHGFKVGWYLDVSNEMRRLMWTLAHTHGTLLSLVHLAFAGSLSVLGESFKPGRLVSPSLTAASILLPGGFFAGGVFIYDGDPGLGILLVPLGALVLLLAVGLTALATR